MGQILSPTRRRAAVGHLRKTFGVSERRACRVVGQPRSAHRRERVEDRTEKRLVGEMRRHAERHPRFGYRRVAALLRRDGWSVNDKRVHRLWRREGLKVPRKRGKRRRLGSSANGIGRKRPTHRNHVWSYDFLFDRTEDGRRLKILSMVDEFTRECLALEFERRIGAEGVVEALRRLVAARGVPKFLRSDNGGEFVAGRVRRWLREAGVRTLFIEPGAPWENAYIESFNGKVRDELLDQEAFANLVEAKYLGCRWRHDYDHCRPHSSLGYRTPAAFAAACVSSGSAALRLRIRTQPRRELVTQLS